jgi:tetratricopeptide (TPR) repeat protein
LRVAARAAVVATPLLPDTDAVTATALGVLAVTLQAPEAGLRFLDEALRRDPAAADAHEHRGLALERLGRRAEALQALETACRVDPADPTAHFNLALVYARAGRLAEARRAAERALALDPSSPHTRELLAALR